MGIGLVASTISRVDFAHAVTDAVVGVAIAVSGSS